MISGGLAGLAGLLEAAGPVGQLVPSLPVGYGFTAIIVAFLGRLHPLGILPAGLVMAVTYIGGEAIQIDMNLPSAVTGVFQGLLLFFCSASTCWCVTASGCSRRSRARAAHRRAGGGVDLIVPILLGIVAAATPLLFAAIGELVVEKSGVLNLGVEGMMIIGAVAGFSATVETGSHIAGVLAAAVAGALLAAIFAGLTQVLMSNQVATGLALTIFGLGVAALWGQGYSGMSTATLATLDIPVLSGLPIVGPLLFGHDPWSISRWRW